MQSDDFVKVFENTLLKQKVNKTICLYKEDEISSSNFTNFSAKDVILNISQQVKAIQTADSITKVKSKKELNKYKTNSFIPVSMMSNDHPSNSKQSNTFDTQCISDTQLIDIIEQAEALMNVEKDINQEFNNNFHDKLTSLDIDQKEMVKCQNNDEINVEIFKENVNCTLEPLIVNNKLKHSYSEFDKKFKSDGVLCVEENTHSLLDSKSKLGDKSFEVIGNNIVDIPETPILNKSDSPIIRSESLSPLVYGLESFEKFEAIAMPIVGENQETSVARKIIHSQIASKELYVQRHTEPVMIDRDKSLSPILKIKKKSTDNNIENNTITTLKNGVFTIEDNILFSSDEENEDRNEELPLTCALTTSFYNEHDLNETMYVGFQTASNKSIQICSESYKKAKSILDDNTGLSLTKLVELNEISGNVIDNNIQKEIIENESTTNKSQEHEIKTVLNTSDHFSHEPTEAMIYSKTKNKLLPLSTSEGGTIEVNHSTLTSDIACLETEQFNIDDNILKEFETNFIVESDDFKNNEDNSKSDSLEIDKDEDMATLGGKNKYVVQKENRYCHNNMTLEEFKTVNKNEIELNTCKLNKDKDVFQDIDLTDIALASLGDYKQNHENRNSYISSTSNTFIGFKTASNKFIKISDHALTNTKRIFQDIENEGIVVQKTKKNNQKATINTNKTEEHSLKPLYPNINEEIKQNTDNIKEIPKCIGFQTANNKPIAVSKEALAKSKKIFQDIGEENSPNNENSSENIKDTFTGLKTASNRTISISKNALQISKRIFDDIQVCSKNIKSHVEENDNLQNVEKFQGFKTASNKPVRISEESLAKTKSIFQDINLDDRRVNKVPVNKLNDDVNTNINIEFQTANNKPVVISRRALAKTKEIFSDTDNINTSTNKSIHLKNKFQGFKTASNKSVKISEDALNKSKNIFKDIEVDVNFLHNSKENAVKSAFFGFKTGNSKPVHISEAALIKSKELFRDINECSAKIHSSPKNIVFSGFQTASNKKVEISEQALLKSKQLFEDITVKGCDEHLKIDSNNGNLKKPIKDNFINNPIKVDDDRHVIIEDLMNNEVIKELEETLYTEDFYKERTPTSKRSSSPILSCPRAKKRKNIEMPKTIKPTIAGNKEDSKNSYTIFTFDPNYKKNKQFNLLNLIDIEKQNGSNAVVDANISKFQFDTLLQFEFGGKRNDIDSDIWTTDKIAQLFTDSVNKKIISKGWIENHLKLIIWKLLSYELVFPKTMNNACTIKNVLCQLKYRYDRELYNVERPALRKILEKDEISSKLIVLCVVGIYVDGVYINSIVNPTQNLELLLTDGWYTIMALTDVMINKLICDGKIIVGTKLFIHGAELVNCEQGVAPWEDISTIRLKIFGNSTRRAKWNARLGFHGSGAILSHLSSVRAEGGKVSRLKVFVTRVYPMLYVERFEDGSTVTRSERLENIYQIKYENEKENQLEKLYEELEMYSDKESQCSESLDTEIDLDSGTQLYKLMKRSKDPAEFKENLTSSQINLLREHSSKKRNQHVEKLQKKAQDIMKKRGLGANRNVIPLLKIRIADGDDKLSVISKATITIWRPNESLLDLIKEGSWIEIFNVIPTSMRYSEIQLSAGRQSIFKKSKIHKSNNIKSFMKSLKRKPYTIKDLQNPITTDYNEIDTCGFIFSIEPSIKEYEGSKQLFQNVYISDENKNVIAINFWGGIKKFGFESLLDIGQIISCVNLQRRHGNIKKCLPQFRVTEFTYFTKTCKIDSLRQMTEELSRFIFSINKNQFIEECVQVKNGLSNTKHGNTDFSPYRLNNSEYNITKNKIFIDSPHNKCSDANLTGLDFESSFRETDKKELSPKTVRRKRKVNEKIATLEMYGEPPPLQTIHIINKSNVINNSYKSPLLTKNVSHNKRKLNNNVASIEKLPDNLSSPVCLNRTYVKNINPVKLNFCNNNDSEDPFAEEFDASPPLSL